MPLPKAIRRLTPGRVRDDPRLRALAVGTGVIPPRTMHSAGEAALLAELARPAIDLGELDPARPTVYFSAEFGVHRSLPIYSGGLGALAGDILKAASDRAMPIVAVGLMYHQGYFRQRIDHSGWQQEYWVETDPDRAPATVCLLYTSPSPRD